MFKCKECGCEFDIKPDYCDCGNDTFDEIVIVQKPKQEEISKPTQTPIQGELDVKEQISIGSRKKTFSEQYPEIERFKTSFDPLSSIVFLICVGLSLIVLFFIGNPEETVPEKTENVQKEVPQINLPSIDNIWNNSTAGIINYEKSTQRTTQLPAQTQTVNPLTSLVQPNQVPQHPVQQTQQVSQPQSKPENNVFSLFGNKNTNAVPNKPVSSAQKQTTQTKSNKTVSQPVAQQKSTVQPKQTVTQQPKPTQTKTANQAPKATNTTSSQPKIPQSIQAILSGNNSQQKQPSSQNVQKQTSAQNTTSTKKPVTTQVPKQTQTAPKTTTVQTQNTLRPKATIDTQALKRELDNYKVGLRNTIGRKVDFTRVIGDGECVVAFKVASNGKLTNRSFAKQSSNITLNDAVYSAVMATPSYNPPPSGYNNETLNLKIRFYNGNYDVSLY